LLRRAFRQEVDENADTGGQGGAAEIEGVEGFDILRTIGREDFDQPTRRDLVSHIEQAHASNASARHGKLGGRIPIVRLDGRTDHQLDVLAIHPEQPAGMHAPEIKATFAIVPPLQMRVMASAADAPNLASAMNIGAFNLGNAIGAAVGGGVISLELGYPAVALAGAVMALGGLLLVLGARTSPKARAVSSG